MWYGDYNILHFLDNWSKKIGEEIYLLPEKIGNQTDDKCWNNPGYYEIEFKLKENDTIVFKAIIDFCLYIYSDSILVKGQIPFYVMGSGDKIESISCSAYGNLSKITSMKYYYDKNIHSIFIRIETEKSYFNDGYIKVYNFSAFKENVEKCHFRYYYCVPIKLEGKNINFN